MFILFMVFCISWSVLVVIFAFKILKGTLRIKREIETKSEYIHEYTRKHV